LAASALPDEFQRPRVHVPPVSARWIDDDALQHGPGGRAFLIERRPGHRSGKTLGIARTARTAASEPANWAVDLPLRGDP
jgi:hypothetical protein